MRRVAAALFFVVSLALPMAAQVSLEKTLTTAPANLDMPETYRLRLSVPAGAQPLTAIGPVVDSLPPGTVFNGATPAADCQPGCVGTTPATVTWTSPCATPLNPGNSCDVMVHVAFPSATYPSGSNVTNSFTVDATPSGGASQTFGPADVTHPVTTWVASPGAGFTKSMASGTPNPPALHQAFSYELNPSNSGNVPLDDLVVIDTLPVEFSVTSVTTGAYSDLSFFAVGEGVRISYEKNTAPGIFTLWGSSPLTTINTTLTAPPPGLGAGEYVTRIRWEYGQAQAGMTATTRPRINGQIINPSNAGGPVAVGATIQNCAALAAIYTAGPTNVNRSDCESFVLSGPFVQFDPVKESLSGAGPFSPGDAVAFRLRVRSDARSSDPMPLEELIVSDLLPARLAHTGWTFDANGTGLPAPQNFTQTPDFEGTGRTLLQWRWDAGSGSLSIGSEVRIELTTTVVAGVAAGSVANDLLLDSDAAAIGLRCSGTSQADALDFDADGDSAETLCSSTAAVTIAAVAEFAVAKDFSDDNAAAVDVSLVCTSGLATPASASASEGTPAVFTVTGYTGTPTCTATETVPSGYTPNETACANVALGSGGCTIVNTLNSASFAVAKDFSDDNAATVDVTLVCTSGLVAPASASASEGSPAVFSVTGFNGTPICTATETAPSGYTPNETACANVALGSGGCTIVNTLNSAAFAVAKDFSDDNAATVDVTLVCTSGLVSPASASASEGSPAVFTVTGFSGAPTCTATETAPAGYTPNEAACANVALGDGGCTIVNTLNSASFAVAKDFSDDNAAAVDVTLVCTSGLVSPASASASEGSPAVFTVTGFSGAPTCTATETAPAGYTPNETACANVALGSGGCTIVNTLNGASFVVTKDFSDDNAAAVDVTLVCTSGLVSPASASASEGSPAIFTVTGFSGTPTCTATETAPAGYTPNETACADVALGDGGCTIVNTLNTASFAVAKDFSDDNATSVDVSLVCTSGLVSPATAAASEGSPAVFTVTGYSGTPACTATEAAVAGYTPDESACASVALTSGGCTILNALNPTTISIVQATSPSPDPTNTLFSYVAGGGLFPTNFGLRDGETQTFDVVPGSGYSIALVPPMGWTLTGATCSNGSSPDSITIVAGENVVCTFAMAQNVNVPFLDPVGLLLMLLSIAGAAVFVLGRMR